MLAAQIATPASDPATQVAGVGNGSLLAAMDRSVPAGTDFYRYATGRWQDAAAIPPDRAAYSISDELNDLTIDQLLGLLNRLSASDTLPEGSDEWKAVQLFAQGIDYETRNAQGIEPIAGDLARIEAISTLEELYAFLRDGVLTTNASGLYGVSASVDLQDSSIYTLWYGGPALGLPNRDYYWEDDAANEPIREAYRATSAKLLGFAGYDEDEATPPRRSACTTSRSGWPSRCCARRRQRPGQLLPPSARGGSDRGQPRLRLAGVPRDPGGRRSGNRGRHRGGVSRRHRRHRQLHRSGDDQGVSDAPGALEHGLALTKEMDDTAFSFYGTTLYGVEEQSPDEEQALGAVNGALGEALGKLYVEEYFPPEAKAQIEELVDHIKAATRARIEKLDWMSPETKAQALAKLDAMRVKVGYPDKWRTYENVTIGDSYVASVLSANIAEYKRELARVGGPVDRDEWGMLPQTVNAYYSPTNNEIVFPAAILQPPFFDYQADSGLQLWWHRRHIGHEITHAFDQSGSKFDANGNLVNWWTPEDSERFTALTDEIVAQYDEVEVSRVSSSMAS